MHPPNRPDQPPLLRLGHPLAALRPTWHNGPGWRVSMWTQGCSMLCTQHCLNPHYLPAGGGHPFAVTEIIAAVHRAARLAGRTLEGITVLGGEPTDQIEAVTALLTLSRSESVSTLLYTGRTLGNLRRHFGPRADALLAVTDLLKDGPYQESGYRPDLAWRGSANQDLHCLSERYTPESLAGDFRRQGKGYSLLLGPDGSVSASGLQNRAAAEEMAAHVQTLLARNSLASGPPGR